MDEHSGHVCSWVNQSSLDSQELLEDPVKLIRAQLRYAGYLDNANHALVFNSEHSGLPGICYMAVFG